MLELSTVKSKMESIVDNKELVLYISIPVTIIILFLSLIYSARNILKIWDAGKPKPDENKLESEDEMPIADEQKEGKEKPEIDALQYCEHIQSEVKKARHRVATRHLNQNLTDEDLEKEKAVQRKQMEDIFKLMEQNSDKFGTATKEDIQQQMKLYV